MRVSVPGGPTSARTAAAEQVSFDSPAPSPETTPPPAAAPPPAAPAPAAAHPLGTVAQQVAGVGRALGELAR